MLLFYIIRQDGGICSTRCWCGQNRRTDLSGTTCSNMNMPLACKHQQHSVCAGWGRSASSCCCSGRFFKALRSVGVLPVWELWDPVWTSWGAAVTQGYSPRRGSEAPLRSSSVTSIHTASQCGASFLSAQHHPHISLSVSLSLLFPPPLCLHHTLIPLSSFASLPLMEMAAARLPSDVRAAERLRERKNPPLDSA